MYSCTSYRFRVTLYVFVLLLLPLYGAIAQTDGPDPALQRVHAADTIRESRQLLRELLETLEQPADLQRAHALIGELSELSGDYSQAQYHYRRAWDQGSQDQPALGLLLLSAQLLLELGDIEAALEEAQLVVERSSEASRQRDAMLLQARSRLAAADQDGAARTVSEVWQAASADARGHDRPGQLYVIYDLARQLELQQVAQETLTALEENHPHSVEYALARTDRPAHRTRVEPLPSPSQVLVALPWVESASPLRAVPSAAGPIAAATTTQQERASEPTVHAIQTGSFRDPENATYMARDISNAGFAAEVRQQSRNGQKLYQVVVPLDSGTGRQQALATMTALKDAGIEGFLLYQ
ncbi:MAG: hypothetical protein EA404_06765 [Spirochaetaceae bacterium]|nr:MAG: hypothetical protein EA404_06765 [Spirochaetaceae bacterium]